MTTYLERPSEPTAGAAELALRRHGLDGHRLLKLASAVAKDAQRKAPAGLGGKYEDLVAFLVEKACRAAVRYDPARSGPGYTFTSYLWDIMERRVDDFYRSKAEGFGDRRKGMDNRLVLAGDTSEEHPHEHEEMDEEIRENWLQARTLLSRPMWHWEHMNERRYLRWVRAVEETEAESFEVWLLQSVDAAARAAEKRGT